MTPQDQATCETGALLDEFEPESRSSTRSCPPKERFTFSPETLLIPVVFATNVGNGIPSTTIIELVRRTVCRLSSISHDDGPNLTAGGISLPEHCDAPGVVQNFSTVMAVLGVIGGITSVVGCGVLSRVSPRYGRKPAFSFLVLTQITWSCLIPASQLMPEGLTDWILFLGILSQVLSYSFPYTYLVDMYIVDVCARENRTAMLSRIGGWGALGGCIPLALGGSITTHTGNPFIVFYISAAIFIATFIYVVFVLPETLPEEKRTTSFSELSIHPTTTPFASSHIFKPLGMLVPTRSTGGSRNWRLTWCAAHSFLFTVAYPFSSSAWLVLVTSKFNLTPADNGVFYTISTVSRMIVLTVIVPPLIRFLRPFYGPSALCSNLVDESATNSEAPKPRTSDYLDVHLTFASCIILAAFFLCAAASTTKSALILSAIFVGLSSLHTPTTHSLVVGSVESRKQGEALAAVEMINCASAVLAPIIMGGVLTATADSAPLLVFYVHLVVVLISAGLILLVRDADGYHKSHEA